MGYPEILAPGQRPTFASPVHPRDENLTGVLGGPRPNIHQDGLVSRVRARLRPMPHYGPASGRQTRAKTWRPKPLGLAQAIPLRMEEEF